MSNKRKIEDDDVDLPNKRQKIEEKSDNDDASKEDDSEDLNSEDSRSDFHDYQIRDLLAPHELYILKKDPLNKEIFADVYSNDITRQRKRDLDPAPLFSTSDLLLPIDTIALVLQHCSADTILCFSMTAKAMLPIIFRARRWRLPHDLKNFYFNRDQQRYNINIKDDVDWIEEYKRNSFNAKRIQDLIQEISRKITEQPDISWKDENDKNLLYPGLSDDEIDEWERKNNYLLTNDLRQLYKCCNGAKFRMVDLEGEKLMVDYWLQVPDFFLPKLENVTVSNEFSLKRLETAAADGIYFDEMEHSDDDEVYEDTNFLTELDPRIYHDRLQREKVTLTEDDFKSDESDESYREISNDGDHKMNEYAQETFTKQGDSDGESSENSSEYSSENSSDGEILPNDNGLKIMLNFGQCRDISNPDDPWNEAGTYELMYEPIMGCIYTIMRVLPSKQVCFANNYRSIVEWLQEISDHLDDPRSHYWVVSIPRHDGPFLILNKDPWGWRTLDTDLGDFWDKFPWALICAEILQYNYFDNELLYMPPRCNKMLAAAAQEFMVKVFERANQLETSDHLRAETLAVAAKELGLSGYEKISFKRFFHTGDDKIIKL